MVEFVKTAREFEFDRAKFPHGVGVWAFEARWAHDVWTHYTVSLISLEPKGGDAPVKMPGCEAATHELLVAALDPKCGMPDRAEDMVILSPVNHVVQFEVANDEQARAVAERMIELMEKKHVHPGEEFRKHFQSVTLAAAEMELFDLVDRKTKVEEQEKADA